MPDTFHKHLPLLFFQTHGLLRVHSDSHAACIYQLGSSLFNRGLTHQLLHYQGLHQPAFTPTLFYTRHLLQKPAENTNQLLHQPAFTQIRFYTNHFYTNQISHELLRAPASMQTNFSINQLLHKPLFATTNFSINQLLHKSAFTQTNSLDKAPFYANHLGHQPALHNPCFGPVGQRPEAGGMPKAAIYIYISRPPICLSIYLSIFRSIYLSIYLANISN